MKLISYKVGDVAIRHSVVRLLGHEEISKGEIMSYLQDGTTLNFTKGKAILSSDRACLYIEEFKHNRVSLVSEHFLITLIAVFPHNFVSKNYLRQGYAVHLPGLRELLIRNTAKSVPVFEAAGLVIDYFIRHNMITEDSVNIYILLYNLLICHSNYFMVLEDTDTVDSALMTYFLGAMKRNG